MVSDRNRLFFMCEGCGMYIQIATFKHGICGNTDMVPDCNVPPSTQVDAVIKCAMISDADIFGLLKAGPAICFHAGPTFFEE